MEQNSRKKAAAWIPRNALAYKRTGKLYSRNIFSEKMKNPRNKIDRFLVAVEHALIDSVLANPGNPQVLVGKWLIKIRKEQADRVWYNITQAIERGELRYYAKVSTSRKNTYLSDTSSNQRLVCVYTPNFLWREDVRKARVLLGKLGFRSRLYYKPDIFTVLEIETVTGTDFGREIFGYLRKYGVHRLKAKYRYFG